MIGVLQIAGAIATVALFIVTYIITRSPWALAAGGAMMVHFYGDALAKFICFGGNMAGVVNVLNNIDKYVKLKAWLQLLGYALIVLGLLLITSHNHGGFFHALGVIVAFVGWGVGIFGFDYKKVYQ